MDLAAIHRLCNNYCWNEGIQNHLTAAVPGRTDQFLIIAFGLLWCQVNALAWNCLPQWQHSRDGHSGEYILASDLTPAEAQSWGSYLMDGCLLTSWCFHALLTCLSSGAQVLRASPAQTQSPCLLLQVTASNLLTVDCEVSATPAVACRPPHFTCKLMALYTLHNHRMAVTNEMCLL